MKCLHPSTLSSGLQVPCGKCIGCRLNKINILAMRAVHEASMHKRSSVVTLTYADAPSQLVREDFDTFWLAVRRWCYRHRGYKPKMIMSGEYGETFGRPHFHACIFGLSAPDMLYLCDKFWKHGFVRVDRFSRRSAEYVVEYICKSDMDPSDSRAPQFVTYSRGLGFDWLRAHFNQVIKDGYVYYESTKMAIPPSYLQFINRKLNGSSKYVKIEDSCPEYKEFRLRLDLANFDRVVSEGKHLALPRVSDNDLLRWRIWNSSDTHSDDDVRIYIGMEYMKHDFSISEVVDRTAKNDLNKLLYGNEDLL